MSSVIPAWLQEQQQEQQQTRPATSGPTSYGPRTTNKAYHSQVVSSGLGFVAATLSTLHSNAPLSSPPTSRKSIQDRELPSPPGPCSNPHPQATSSTPSTVLTTAGSEPWTTDMTTIIPSITSHNHTPASYTTSSQPMSASTASLSSHHKKSFVPPSIKLNQFFASIDRPSKTPADAPAPTPAAATKSGAGGRGGVVVGLVGTGSKFKGLAGGVASSAKGKIAQAKKAKALKAQKVKADKVAAAQAAQAEAEAEQAARRRQQQQQQHQQVTYEDEDEYEDERDYEGEYDDDGDYTSSGDAGDSESEGSDSRSVGSAPRSTNMQQPHPAHLAALSPDTTYTVELPPTLPHYKGSHQPVDSDEDVVAHVEYATERDFVESTSTQVSALEEDPDHPAAKYAHQSRYSSEGEVEPDDPDRDDEYRGRSRRPRLLWRSRLAEPTVSVLDHYCREYYSMELPRLKGKGSPEGRKWSRQLDQAGL
ncbi:BQ2448_3727 [Microbotryum intermedium]|uniref:BQ2448_3727 protein n=1 Tax=Microbotryum intermedium TaxID=269621 RepID=A0A238FCP8_9BASI|nr:BQ2448_3727 [Microbotryum intermedium]